MYGVPILSLVWLWGFGHIGVSRPDYLLMGASAIVVANLLFNFEAEIRLGFKSLIVALWICGVVAYLRDAWSAGLNVSGWLWSGAEVYYFDVLILLATVFILILSFRVARLVARTTDEDNRFFQLFQTLDLLVRRGVVDRDVHGYLINIEVSGQRARELEESYVIVLHRLREASSATWVSDSDKENLMKAEADLNALVHSKNRGMVFGEHLALYMFAGISVFIALFARPGVATNWTGFLLEMFSTVFPAVIIFLVVNVHDLQSDRVAANLERSSDAGYRVVFADIRDRDLERWISTVVVIFLVVGFSALMVDKWGIYDWMG